MNKAKALTLSLLIAVSAMTSRNVSAMQQADCMQQEASFKVFFAACKRGDAQNVQIFLENGCKKFVNCSDKYGETPLCSACYKNSLEVVKLLLPHCMKETINKPDNDRKTPLYLVCRSNNLEMVKLIFPHCMPEIINGTDQLGGTPLYRACRHGNLEMIKLLLPHCTKETINKTYEFGQTLLDWACSCDNLEIVQLLVENGATIEENDIQQVRNYQIRIYLQHAYNFQQAENKLAFILRFINENEDQQEIIAIVRLAFCLSLRQMQEQGLEIEETFFYQINEIAQSNFKLADTLLQTLNTIDPCCIKTREMQEMLENYRDLLRDFPERHEFVVAQKIGNGLKIETDDRKIEIPKLFY